MRPLSKSTDALTKNQYDVVTVVPAFNEDYILRILQSIALQQEVTAAKIAVVIAVNNGPDASPAIRCSNSRTIALVQAIWDQSPPDDLLKSKVSFLSSRDVAKAFDACAKSPHSFIVADASTRGHEIPGCNVGRARNAGGELALGIVKPDGMLAFTDADSGLAEKYMKTLLELRAQGCEAATGPISYEPDTTRESIAAARLMGLRNDMRACHRTIAKQCVRFRHPLPTSSHVDERMPGANLTVSPDRFAEVRFPPVAGGEDIAFSLELIRRGVQIRWHQGLRVHTPLRVSLRTERGHGLGQWVAEEAQFGDRYTEYPVETLNQYLYLNALVKHLEWVRTQEETWGLWKQRVAAFCFRDAQNVYKDDVAPLTREEVSELWQEFQRAPGIIPLKANDFLKNAAARIATRRFPKAPLPMVICDTREFLLQHEKQFPPDRRNITRILEDDRRDRGPNAPLAVCLARLSEAIAEMAASLRIDEKPMRVAIGLPWGAAQVELLELRGDIFAISRALNLSNLIGAMESWSDEIASFEQQLSAEGCKPPKDQTSMADLASEIRGKHTDAFYMDIRAMVASTRIKPAYDMLADDPNGYLMEVRVFIRVLQEKIRQKKEEALQLYLSLEKAMRSYGDRAEFPEKYRAKLQDMLVEGLQIKQTIEALGNMTAGVIDKSNTAVVSENPSAGT